LAAERVDEAQPLAAREILRAAFSNRYEVNTISRLDLVMRNRAGYERRRAFHTVTKIIEGRLHSIGRLVAPEFLRGMTVMVIEAKDQRHDSFIFMPSLGRVRRVSTAQRGDAFLGSDLTYEDFERQRVEDYDAEFEHADAVEGEPCHLVRARPKHRYTYDHVDFLISQVDQAILESRYFKREAGQPYRTIKAPREFMASGAGHTLPTRLTVTNSIRGTTTEVRIHELAINPSIDDRVFSIGTLDQEKDLPEPVD